MTSETPRALLYQIGSLLVAWFVLLSIFALYSGLVDGSFILPVCLLVGTAVVVRYAAVHHRFAKSTHQIVVVLFLTVAFFATAGYTVTTFLDAVTLEALRAVFRQEPTLSLTVLPTWWPAVLLAIAGVLLFTGVVRTRALSPYPKPTSIRTIADSPVAFGLVCAFFGFWAVLLVGFAIQRIIVIAPIFEELLKFGLAILVGSALFGRSLSARIGVALVVGALFGLIEHTTSYATESALTHLFRTCFHAMTTILSVTLYSIFESLEEARLRWIAPVYAVLIHFFYNTFVVLSAVIGIAVFGEQHELVPLIYGAAAILLGTSLLVIAVLSRRTIVAMHRPFEYVLSDLV